MRNFSKKSISPFLETICIDRGVIKNIAWHQQRFDQTRSAHWPDALLPNIDLTTVIEPPDETALYRCRLLYRQSILSIEYLPYAMRPVERLQLVEDNHIEYEYKSSDRQAIDRLFAQRGEADDILIVRHGLITDTSIANVALLQNGIWYTPEMPLLNGCRRAQLIANGQIMPRSISHRHLDRYEKIALFNAMIDFPILTIPLPEGVLPLPNSQRK